MLTVCLWAAAVLALLAGCNRLPATSPGYQVVIGELDEPRGLWLRADGTLCVAEAGRLSAGQQPGDGPVTIFADTGALTCQDASGSRSRVLEGLPYVLYSATGVSVGPADVAELDGALYLLTGEGYGDLSRKLLRVEDSGPPTVIADLLEFAAQGKPLEYFQPASIPANPYAMVADAANRRFLVTDGASGQVVAVSLDGRVEVVTPGEKHPVLTGIAWGPDGAPYIASFSPLPHAEAKGAVFRAPPGEQESLVLENLTTPIDLAFDSQGRLYVLEFLQAGAAGNPYLNQTGRILRFERRAGGFDSGLVVVDGLPYPTAMLFSPDDSLFVSIHGAFSQPGSGAVLRFDDLGSLRSLQAPLLYLEEGGNE